MKIPFLLPSANTILFIGAVTAITTASVYGYGDKGHQTVGAMADQLIAHSPNTVARVRALLGGKSLEDVSTWADDCKHHLNPNDPEMVAFVHANPHDGGAHDHFLYHYTDIPIQEAHYRNSSEGARPGDVVHMIRNCIAILEGHSNARNNPTGIPQKTALRLLVHYVGDVHQPLHVGAAYFGPNGQLENPNTVAGAQADQGGNAISFHGTKLHTYWDDNTVNNAMSKAHARTPEEFATKIIRRPPSDIKPESFISSWSRKWADEQLPIAAEAHHRLTFQRSGHGWTAHSTNIRGYDSWAADEVRAEIGRAGYRLAAILVRIWP